MKHIILFALFFSALVAGTMYVTKKLVPYVSGDFIITNGAPSPKGDRLDK